MKDNSQQAREASLNIQDLQVAQEYLPPMLTARQCRKLLAVIMQESERRASIEIRPILQWLAEGMGGSMFTYFRRSHAGQVNKL